MRVKRSTTVSFFDLKLFNVSVLSPTFRLKEKRLRRCGGPTMDSKEAPATCGNAYVLGKYRSRSSNASPFSVENAMYDNTAGSGNWSLPWLSNVRPKRRAEPGNASTGVCVA